MRFKKRFVLWAVLPALMVLLTVWCQRPAVRQARLDRRLVAALHAHDTDAALAALRQGADPNTRDYYETPSTLWVRIIHPTAAHADDENRAHNWQPVLFTAIYSNDAGYTLKPDQAQGNSRVIQALLDRGADVNGRDCVGNGALFFATTERRLDWVMLLLNHGADNGCKAQALLPASLLGDTPVVLLLIDRGADVNALNTYGSTPLIYACTAQHWDIARILLGHGAAVNVKDGLGWTALRSVLASRHPDLQLIRLLKEHGTK